MRVSTMLALKLLHIKSEATPFYGQNTPFAQSIVAYWPLQEVAGEFPDIVGGHDATNPNGVVTPTPGHIYPEAAYFPTDVPYGTPRLVVPHDEGLVPGDESWWISGWFRLSDYGGINDIPIIGKYQAYGLSIQRSSPTSLRFISFSNSSPYAVSVGQALGGIPAEAWQMATGVMDKANNSMRVYWNATPASGESYRVLSDAENDLQIGQFSPQSTGSFWRGKIGPLMVGRGYAPTDEDIKWLYNNGQGRP